MLRLGGRRGGSKRWHGMRVMARWAWACSLRRALAAWLSRQMADRRWGRIINIGSSSAYAGFKNTAIYCASKHALLGLTRSLHDELRHRNVRCFCISPGSIKTEMGRSVTGQDLETFLDPQEIAEFVVHVASYDCSMITDEIRLNRMVIR